MWEFLKELDWLTFRFFFWEKRFLIGDSKPTWVARDNENEWRR